jgi:hypothetical protein
LIRIQNLQIEKNEFESILKVEITNGSSELKILNLKSNNIKKIEANSFNGLLKLKLINLLNNSINDIDSNGFNNTNFKEILLSISNISIEMIRILTYSLKPNLAYKSWIYEYYDSIYIENRLDIDCFKMFFLIKFKLYYNFINDNVDINDMLGSDCLNLIQVRDNLNEFNDTFLHQNYISKPKPVKDKTYAMIIWIVICLIFFILLFIFIYNSLSSNLNLRSKNNKLLSNQVNEIILIHQERKTEFEKELENLNMIISLENFNQ